MLINLLFVGAVILLSIVVCVFAFVVAISTSDENTSDDIY